MDLTSLPSRLVLLLTIMAAFAFNGDDDMFSFYLSADRIFAPADSAISVDISGNNVSATTLSLRAFKVDNPVEFFIAQKDPHSPSLAVLAPPNTFDMIEQGVERVRRDARYAARDIMPADARRAMRDVADLNSTRAARRDSVKKPARPTAPGSGEDIPKGAERYQIVASWTHKLRVSKEDNWSYEKIPVPIKEKGVYIIEARARGRRAITALVISEYGMVMKQAAGVALAFVVDRRSGERITGMPLTFARGGTVFAEKETDGDGLLRVEVPDPVRASADAPEDFDENRWYQRDRQVLVVGERDGNLVISDPYYYGYDRRGTHKLYLHTDRPVYRPGQIVYYRAIIRSIAADGTYGDATVPTARVEVHDARDGLVRRDTLAISANGTISGQIQLGEEPPLGTYSIRVSVGEGSAEWFNFSVEEYKKPEYKVEVVTDRANYTRGDVITADVRASYFFGSPVANATVEYFVYRARYWRPWWRGSDWAYLYEESDDFATYRMEMVASQEATLQADGTLRITYATPATAEQDYVYRIQVNVVDNSRRSISGAKSVEVTRGSFYLATRTDKYVYKPGDRTAITVEAATFDGDRPVGVPFTARVVRTWWDQVTNGDRVDYQRHTETIWTGRGTTGSDGRGTIEYVTERAGYFAVEIEATDERGTPITESTYIYVADEEYANWYREGSGDVRIIPDKASYTPGETMSALIVLPAPKLDVLVSTEASTLYTYRVERLTNNSAVVHIPIEAHYAPMFYLSAAAIVNDELYMESERITVIPKGKVIRLEVTTDRQIYRPAQKGSVMVKATDEDGRPVAGVDVALGMVDEAVYSIMPDATPDMQRAFYGSRWNEVATSNSLQFSFYGESRRLAESADALYSSASPLDEVRARGDGDRTLLAYGDVKGQQFVQPSVRRNFKDMMFWTPSAVTGTDGTVRLDVEFPDNLTTWRITARGVTRATAVGQTVTRVIARKDLLVRMETPRFLTEGDELLIATTVHNYLSTAKQTKVEFAGANVTTTERERTVTISANGEQRLDWKIVAPAAGTAMLTVKALTDQESDALELSIPVLPRGIRIATGTSADVSNDEERKEMRVTIPAANATSPTLTVSVAPSLAGSLLGALDELIGYPYGCVEQTMSRFLPTIVVNNALEQLGLPFDQKRRAEIPKMVSAGLGRLYSMQSTDGGWGWWSNDRSDPFMTAYVVYGLTVARRSNIAVDEERYRSGVERLDRSLGGIWVPASNVPANRLNATEESYVAYVLSLVREGAPGRELVARVAELAKRDTLNHYAIALLALASRNVGDRRQAERLVSVLESNVTDVAGATHWTGGRRRYYWDSDLVETTAMAVDAILQVRGETDLAQRAIRWLMLQRRGDAWHNTRQSAIAIYALTNYLRASRELEPDFAYTVLVNGREAAAGRFTTAQVFGSERVVTVDPALLRAGDNVITVRKQGRGRLYGSARLTYVATGDAMRAARAGFNVRREYWLLRKEKSGDRYVYSKQSFSGTVRTGDELFVKVTVEPDARYEYFMLEDPLPAGCEVIRNTDGYTIPGEPEYDEQARRDRGWWSWYWWYSEREVRDEKVSFFARQIDVGPRTFSYVLRAQIPGTYSIMPSVASLMYYPEVRGNAEARSLRVTE